MGWSINNHMVLFNATDPSVLSSLLVSPLCHCTSYIAVSQLLLQLKERTTFRWVQAWPSLVLSVQLSGIQPWTAT